MFEFKLKLMNNYKKILFNHYKFKLKQIQFII